MADQTQMSLTIKKVIVVAYWRRVEDGMVNDKTQMHASDCKMFVPLDIKVKIVGSDHGPILGH